MVANAFGSCLVTRDDNTGSPEVLVPKKQMSPEKLLNKFAPKKSSSVLKIEAQNKTRMSEIPAVFKTPNNPEIQPEVKLATPVRQNFSEKYPTQSALKSRTANSSQYKLVPWESASKKILPHANVLELDAKKTISKNSPTQDVLKQDSLEKYGIIRSFSKRDDSRGSADKIPESFHSSARYSTDNFYRLKTELDEILSLSRRESRASEIASNTNQNAEQAISDGSKLLAIDSYFKVQGKPVAISTNQVATEAHKSPEEENQDSVPNS